MGIGERMEKLYYLILFLTLLVSTSGYSQISTGNEVVHAFEQFRSENFQEKIYVHNDRSSYLTGETMWFKVYVVDASFHRPSAISKVVYMELLDARNQPVLQSKVEIKDGSGTGTLYLPVSINTGTYTLRAYTNWMKNYSPDFYFHKEVLIINSFKNQETIAPTQANYSIEANFFPEGGHLISGIKSKVGFQVVDADGSGIDCTGIILDENLDTVLTFSPHRFGIGNFHLTPQPDKKYTAVIRDGNETPFKFDLPTPLKEGYVMQVEEQSNKLLVHVQTNIEEAYSSPVYLFVHSRNRIVKAGLQKMEKGVALLEVNLDQLPDGISHLTIFDRSQLPVSERLYFKHVRTNLSVSVKQDQTTYLKRSTVKMNLDISAGSKTDPLNLSVAVFKADSLPVSKLSIKNYLMLISDLRGTVESPEFYFQQESESNVAIDNLMLTHGWRRFRWNEVLSKEKAEKEFIPEYNGHIIQGLITGENNLPVFGSVAYLSSPAKIIWTHPGRSGRDGKVYFEMQKFYGKSKIIGQLDPLIDSTSTLSIISPFSVDYANRKHRNYTLTSNWENQLISRSISMQVENIYASTALQADIIMIDSSAFYGKADATYFLDDFTRFPVLEEVLREYVPGVFVRKRKNGFNFLVVNKDLNTTFRLSPLILLDGVPIFDEDEIMSFDPRLIKKLEVIQRRWFLGPVSFFGIVSFSTYNGDLAGFELNPKSIALDFEGLQKHQEFYSPKYENKKQRDSRIPDQRTLLYWNPMIVTDTTGHAEFEFYSSDISGEYHVVVEGLSAAGEGVSHKTSLVVKDSN